MEKALKTSRKNIDMTEGPLFGKILLFVLPMMATNLLQTAYNAADMMVVSLSSEENAVGAIGMTVAFVNLVLNLFIGFSVGANVVIARYIGAKNDEAASRVVHTSLSLAVILGLFGTLLGLCISRPVLTLMGADGNLLDLATTYTKIYFAGAPFIALTNYASSIFRAKGDTKTPLYVLTVSGFANVLMNVFFVLVCGLSVEGVALATVLSNVISAVVLLFCLYRSDDACRFDLKKLRIDRVSLREVVRMGLPAGLQSALFSFSNIMIQSSVLRVNNILAPGSMYEPVVEGNAAVSNLNGFIYTATNSIYQASIAFTSQNVGAGKYDRIKKVMLNSYAITIIVAIIASAFILLLNRPLLALYGVHEGEGIYGIAYDAAMNKIRCETTTYFLLAIMEVGCGVLRGLGKAVTSTLISLIGACLLRVVWLLTVFEHFLTLESIYISYPVSWFITGVAALIFDIVILRKYGVTFTLKKSSENNAPALV